MIPVIGFAGYSDSGKTTLIAALVRHFRLQGKRIGVIKHDGHGHYKEAEGTDSSKYKEAGADAAVVVSPDSLTVYRRKPLTFDQVVAELQNEKLDLILVEGFKRERHDQIAVYRNAEQGMIMQRLPKPPIAVIAPRELHERQNAAMPAFEPEHVESIADFIVCHIGKQR